MKFICLHCESAFDSIPELCRCGRRGSKAVVSEARFWENAARLHLREFQRKCGEILRGWSLGKCRGCVLCAWELGEWAKEARAFHEKTGFYYLPGD